MNDITKFYNCGGCNGAKGCDFFLPTEGLDHAPDSGIIARPDANSNPATLAGFCRKEPPALSVQNVPGLMAGQTRQMVQRFYPPMNANEICSHHSALPERTVTGIVEFSIKRFIIAWSDMLNRLSYQPSEHGDGHAGFNRPPTLNEARQYAPKAETHAYYGLGETCAKCGKFPDDDVHKVLVK